MTHITRRRLFGGFFNFPAFAPGLAAAASEAPNPVREARTPPAAPPAVLAPERPLDRIDRLADELAEALDEWSAGLPMDWCLVVPRASAGRGWYTIKGAPSHRRDGRVS